MTPLVSVVIATYNRSAFLVEAIESVLAQTRKDVEIIVVDDGSTDDTQKLLAPYRRSIKYIFQTNSGVPSRARNVGIRLATGEYIAILDSDDIMFRQKLVKQVEFLEKHRDVGMVFTDFSLFANGRVIRKSFLSTGHARFLELPKTPVGQNEYILYQGVCDCLALDDFVCTPSVVARKLVFDRVGLFDESIRTSEDLEMWFRIAEKFPLGYIDLPLTACRIHRGNISSPEENVIRDGITVHERFLKSAAISPRARSELKRRLGGMYVSLAYLQLNEGKDSEARFNLSESLKRRPIQLAGYKLLCASLVPRSAREPLRKVYRAAVR